MLVRKPLPPLLLQGKWETDGPLFVKWVHGLIDYLNGRDALQIDEAQIMARNGIKFPSVDVASTDSHTLDDYEEGTWTPTLTFATPGNLSLAAYSVREGSYTKIGRLVICSLAVTVVPTHTTAAGALQLTGLPFAASSDSNYQGTGDTSWGGITKATYTQVSARVSAGTSIVDFFASGSGVARSAVIAADVPSAGTVALRSTIIYRI